MMEERTVSVAWAERRINDVARERDELRSRLNTIFRAQQVVGLCSGGDPDYDICKMFGDYVRLKDDAAFISGLLDGVPINRSFPQTRRVSILVEQLEQLRTELAELLAEHAAINTIIDRLEPKIERTGQQSNDLIALLKQQRARITVLEEELKEARAKADAWQKRAVDAERRATHAVGRAKRMGVGFGRGGA